VSGRQRTYYQQTIPEAKKIQVLLGCDRIRNAALSKDCHEIPILS